MRRILAVYITLLLGLVGLGVVGVAPAQAAPNGPTICSTCITFDPARTTYDEASETLTAVIEVDVPGDWVLVSAKLLVRDATGTGHTDWLKLDSEKRLGQRDLLTMTGKVPNQVAGGVLNRGYLRVFPEVYYHKPNNAFLYFASYGTAQFYHQYVGETKGTLVAPATIPTGSALTLTGQVSCFKAAGFQTVEEGAFVEVRFSTPGANTFTGQGGTAQASKIDGTWSVTIPAVGATLDWRANLSPNSPSASSCAQDRTTPVVNVVAGTEPPPPPPPTLPGAPGLVVSGTTPSSISVNWTAPTSSPGQSAITGYRFGWVSATGQPSPTFSEVVPVPPGPANPYTFAGLAAGTGYSVFVEAVTADGTGARTTLSATTATVPPPPPAAKAPGAPRSVEGQARSHKAIITWDAPESVPGATITKYCVHRFNSSPDKCVGASKFKVKFKGLTNGLKYSFTVQAFAGDIPGPLSSVVKVKPKKG